MFRKRMLYALGWVLLFSLSACGQTGGTSTDTVSLRDLLRDGFYGTPPEDKARKTADQQTKEAEVLPADGDAAEMNTDEDAKSEQDIVASIGFSTVEDSQPATPDKSLANFSCVEKDDLAAVGVDLSSAQACEKISTRLASVSLQDCEQAQLRLSNCKSVEQFPILVREFAPLPDREPQGRILVIGGTHGDELTSVSIVFRWIEKLNLYHSGLFHWRIAPMMNPDGVLKKAASRTNQRGVDLNRNLPSDDWSQNALKYWAEKSGKNKRRYPGPHAASEPETQWLVDEINTFKPDAIISVHAPFGVVDYDALVLKSAPKNLGKLALNLLGTYPGSLGNYAGINRNIPVITLELPHAWVMPSENETAKIWADIVSWLSKNVNQPGQTASAN